MIGIDVPMVLDFLGKQLWVVMAKIRPTLDITGQYFSIMPVLHEYTVDITVK